MGRPFGPFRPELWKSPIRGPWLVAFLGTLLLPLVTVCAVTGFLSHAAYDPNLAGNAVVGRGGGPSIYVFDWPTSPAWLYAFTQSLHVLSGLALIPVLLVKLWAVIPRLFEWPPLRSPAQALERLSLALLVGGSLFVVFTGVQNIAYWYPWGFNFVPAHYYAAIVFLAAFALHVSLKLRTVRRELRERGWWRLLRDRRASREPQPWSEDSTAPLAPGETTISRRGVIGLAGAASAGLVAMAAGQSIGGPLRETAIFAPRGPAFAGGEGPNAFPVNGTFAASGISRRAVGPGWRLELGEQGPSLSRADLLAMDLHTYALPIGCVEGWTTKQTWTGVRLRDLAELAGVVDAEEVLVESLQPKGAFRTVRLTRNKIEDERSLLALRVNGADLALDHGYPARIIVPALPGVHNTKWVARLGFSRERTEA